MKINYNKIILEKHYLEKNLLAKIMKKRANNIAYFLKLISNNLFKIKNQKQSS
jgi:hypothetical protein